MTFDSIEKKAYDDTLSPVAKSTGSFLKDLVDATRYKYTQPLQSLAVKQRLMDRFKDLAQDFPMEQLVQPHTAISTPLLEVIEVRGEGEPIYDAAMNMLLSASIADQQSKVHPAFAMKLGEMADDELELLRSLQKEKQRLDGERLGGKAYMDSPHYPLVLFDSIGLAVDYFGSKKFYSEGNKLLNGQAEHIRVFDALLDISSLVLPERIGLYITHLETQGFIKILEESDLNADQLFMVGNRQAYNQFHYISGGQDYYDHRAKLVVLTEMGRLLLECTEPVQEQQLGSV